MANKGPNERLDKVKKIIPVWVLIPVEAKNVHKNNDITHRINAK